MEKNTARDVGIGEKVMNYTIIYKNDKGRFKKVLFLYYAPQVGNFIVIYGCLYRVDNIEIIPSGDTIDDFYNAPLMEVYKSTPVILYCTESKNYKNESREHWLDNLDTIKEEYDEETI